MNIPICRAKKIDSDKYVKGHYSICKSTGKHFITLDTQIDNGMGLNRWKMMCFAYEIDPTTLAIHFPDMLDSQGNKIFASLNVKGGSLLEYEGTIYEVMYLNYLIQGVANMHSIKSELFEYTKLIGIQE